MKTSSVMTSAAVSGGTVSGSAVVIWLFKCLEAEAIVTPDQITATAMAGFLFPILYTLRDAWIGRLSKDLPDAADVISATPAAAVPVTKP
jgi:hypothetical protein